MTTIFNRTVVPQTQPAIPDYSQVALVPIANPATAIDLLHLAVAIAHPEQGRIIALNVSISNTERSARSIGELESVVEQIRAEGYKIELESVVSPSISRGILDAARDYGADLIFLGIKRPVRGQIQLGSIVSNVLETAPCDVLVYRMGATSDFKRVVMPLDNSFQSRVAARVGLHIARRSQTAIEAMHAQAGHRSEFEGLAIIEQALADVPGSQAVKRTVISAHEPADGILSRIDDDDLVVAGFNDSSEFERLVFGDVAYGLLNRASGPVVLVARSASAGRRHVRAWRRALNWVRPALTPFEQDEIIRHSQFNATLDIDYVALIFISANIAALGLMLNSAAVIIGAMLVAPLMTPLIALSVALTVGRVRIAGRAFVTLTLGVLMALAMAFVIGATLPFSLPTSEMLARGTPTLLDAGVALASGVVGAYATARKDIPAALAGVAIAAALMPPLCTIGLGLAFGDFSLAFGAAVLFLTNIICIIMAGIGVFVWLGMRPTAYPGVTRRMQAGALGLLVIAALPVSWELYLLTQQVSTEAVVRRELIQGMSNGELVRVQVQGSRPLNILATVRTYHDMTLDDVIEMESRIGGALNEQVRLELLIERVVRLVVDDDDNGDNGESAANGGSATDFPSSTGGESDASGGPESVPETTPATDESPAEDPDDA